MASKYSNITFQGFRRDNGRVGVRNHVVILPVDDISNAAVEAVALRNFRQPRRLSTAQQQSIRAALIHRLASPHLAAILLQLYRASRATHTRYDWLPRWRQFGG